MKLQNTLFTKTLELLSSSLEVTNDEARNILLKKEINESNFNSISELSLSGSKKLKNVDFLIGFPEIQGLNLSECTNLENLDGIVHLEHLEDLDLSWCESLESILQLLKCNNLNELNLTCTSQKLNSDTYDLISFIVLDDDDEETLLEYEWDENNKFVRLEGDTIFVENDETGRYLGIKGAEQVYES